MQKTITIARITNASAFCVSLPAPRLKAWSAAKMTMKSAAMSERGENVKAPTKKLIESKLRSEASVGKYCPRYMTKATELAATAPEKPAISDVQPERKPAA